MCPEPVVSPEHTLEIMKLRLEGSTVASFISVIVLFIFSLFTLIFFSFCIEYVLLREKINYYT